MIERTWIDDPFPAYVARPARGGTGSAVLVGFEMFGLTDYVCRVTDRLASLGHTALAPDFYHRFGERLALPVTDAGREQGFGLLRRIDRSMIRADVQAAVGYLRADGADGADGADKINGLGLSVGGHFLFYGATQVPFDALALLYPGWLTTPTFPFAGPEPTLDLTANLAAHGTRTLVLVGADDHVVDAAPIEARLTTEKVDHEVVVYPDTPHGYFCDERETWRRHEAEDTWIRVTTLFSA
jgi:carboxymethylenebutenolidase